MIRQLFALAILLLFAGPAFADDSGDWDNGSNKVGSGGKIWTEFTTALNPLTINFTITTQYALACLKPDITANGPAGSVTAAITYCNPGTTTPAAASCIVAEPAAGGSLDGTEGSPAVQKACIPLGTGTYFVTFTAPSGAETSRFSVEGQ